MLLDACAVRKCAKPKAKSNMSLLSIIKNEEWKLVSLSLNHPKFTAFDERDAADNTALHILVQKTFPKEYALIPRLAQYVNVNARNARGKTPLHMALATKHHVHEKASDTDGASNLEAARELLEQGASVNVHDKFGYSPLYYATLSGSIKAVQLLYNEGADLNYRDRRGENVLHLAARCNHRVLIVFFLNKGVDINALNHCDQSPLEVALDAGNSDIALVLIGGSAKPCNLKEAILFTSVRLGNLQVSKVLVKAIGVNPLDAEGRTPLHVATEEGHFNIVAMLLQKNAEVNLADLDGYTALHVAVQKGHLHILQALITHAQAHSRQQQAVGLSKEEQLIDFRKLDFYRVTNSGDNILHLLAAANMDAQLKMDTFYVLLQLSLKKLVVRTNRDFRTPLHFANQRFCRPLIMAFINLGADVDEIDRFGRRPSDYCTEPSGGRIKVIKKESFTRVTPKHAAR